MNAIYRTCAITLSLCLAYSGAATGINGVVLSARELLQRLHQAPAYSERPTKVYLGPKPGRDAVYRNGRWTPQTLRDLRAIETQRLVDEELGLWASLDAVIQGQGGGGGGDASSDEDTGSGGGPSAGGGGGSSGSGGGSGGPSANVNTNTGNRLASVALVGWAARGDLGVGFTLYHNSLGDYPGEAGWGWSHSYEVKLNYTTGSSAIIHWGDGTEVAFTEDEGTFTPPPGFYDALVHNTNGTWTLTSKHQAVYDFRADGFLTAIRDRASNQITIARASDGKITTVTDPSSRQLSFSYSSTTGKLNSVTGPNSKTWSFTRDTGGDLTAIDYPTLNSQSYTRAFTYNSAHDIASETDLRGKVWTYGYDSGGRMTWWKTPSPLSEQTSYTFNTTNTVMTRPGAQTVTHNYSSGALASEVDEATFNDAYTWDSNKNLTQYTDKRGKDWIMTYDSMGNRLTKKNPLNKTWTYTHNSTNDLTKVKDPLNHEVTITVNSQGKATSVVDAMSRTVRTNTYDSYGQLATTKNGANEMTTYSRNTHGQVIGVTNPSQKSASINRDLYNQVTSITDPLSRTTMFELDAWSRVKAVTFADEMQVSHVVDAEGLTLSSTDEMGRSTSSSYDVAGRLISVSNQMDQTTTFVRNSNGVVTKAIKPMSQETVYGLTPRGEVSSVQFADGVTTSLTYGGNGEVLRRTSASGIYVDYVYDYAGQLEKKDYPSGTDVTFSYDDAGRMTQMVDSTGTTTWSYNDADESTGIAMPQGTVTFSYDQAGRIASVADTVGTISYSRDSAGRLTGTSTPIGISAAYTYDDNDRVMRRLLSTGVSTDIAYDVRSRVSELTHKKSDGTTLGSESYSYDDSGRLMSKVVSGTTTTFDYDDVGRLISEDTPSRSAEFVYNANGDLIERTVNSDTKSLTYNSAGRLTAFGGASYTLDAAGRRATRVDSSGTTSYAYDYDGRLVSVQFPNSATNTYTYNGLGARVGLVDSTGTRSIRRAGPDPSAPILNDGLAIFAPGVGEQRGSDVRAYHFDAFGTVSWLSTVGQVLSNQRQYDFFGSLIGSTGSTWSSSVGVGGAGGSARDDTDTGWHNSGGGSYLDPGGQGFPSKREVEVTDAGWPTDIPDGRDWFDKTTDFMAGLGDELSMGLTGYVRGVMGTDEFVNTGSPQYGFGQAGAVAIQVIAVAPGIKAGIKAIIGAAGHGHHVVTKQVMRRLDDLAEDWWMEIRKDYWSSTGKNVIRMPAGDHMAMHWWGRNGMGRYNPWWLKKVDGIKSASSLEAAFKEAVEKYNLVQFL